jgi:hypothetical protein
MTMSALLAAVPELENMPGSEQAMARVEAWFASEVIDRPPVRFMAHNAFLEQAKEDISSLSPAERKAWWFDAELQLSLYEQSIAGQTFHGETFPVYWPNLGPEVYAAFYGSELVYGQVTSWSIPLVRVEEDASRLRLDLDNDYFRTLERMTALALDRCAGRYLVGYTDLHPGLDCVAAWRDPQQLCLDLIDRPELVETLAAKAIADFETIYNHFDALLKAAGQLSVSWMGIPSYGRMHIPSCDFASMISPAFFRRFSLPILQREVRTMSHNVFHVDGKGVARHLDAILSVPGVHALQWVQGMGDDQPIMQWLPFLKDLQARRVPVVVDLSLAELEPFMAEMAPEGLFLWVATTNEAEEQAVLNRLLHWT